MSNQIEDITEEQRQEITSKILEATGIKVDEPIIISKIVENQGLKYEDNDFLKILDSSLQQLALKNYFGMSDEKVDRSFHVPLPDLKDVFSIPLIYDICLDPGSPAVDEGFLPEKENQSQIFNLLSLQDLLVLAHPNPTLEERVEGFQTGEFNKFKALRAFNEYEARKIIFQEFVNKSKYYTKPHMEKVPLGLENTNLSRLRLLSDIIHSDSIIRQVSKHCDQDDTKSGFYNRVKRNYNLIRNLNLRSKRFGNLLEKYGFPLAMAVENSKKDNRYLDKLKLINGNPKEFLNIIFDQDKNGFYDPIIEATYQEVLQENFIGERVNIYSPTESDLRRTIYSLLFNPKLDGDQLQEYSHRAREALKNPSDLKEIQLRFSQLVKYIFADVQATGPAHLSEKRKEQLYGKDPEKNRLGKPEHFFDTDTRSSEARRYLINLVNNLEDDRTFERRAIVNSSSPVLEIHDEMGESFCLSNGNPIYKTKYMEAAQYGLANRIHPAVNTLGLIADYEKDRNMVTTPYLGKAITIDCYDTKDNKKCVLIDGVVVPNEIMISFGDWQEYFFDKIFKYAIKNNADSVLVNLQNSEYHPSTHLFKEYAIKKAIEWSSHFPNAPQYYEDDFHITTKHIDIRKYYKRLRNKQRIFKFATKHKEIEDEFVYSHILRSKQMDNDTIKRLNKGGYNYMGQIYSDAFRGFYEKAMQNVFVLQSPYMRSQFTELGLPEELDVDIMNLIISNRKVIPNKVYYHGIVEPHLNFPVGGVVAVEIPVKLYKLFGSKK